MPKHPRTKTPPHARTPPASKCPHAESPTVGTTDRFPTNDSHTVDAANRFPTADSHTADANDCCFPPDTPIFVWVKTYHFDGTRAMNRQFAARAALQLAQTALESPASLGAPFPAPRLTAD